LSFVGIIRVPVSFPVFPDEPARTRRKVLEQQSRLRDRTRGRHAVCRPAGVQTSSSSRCPRRLRIAADEASS